MSSSYGENIHLTIFGQSHSAAIGMTLEGMPAGCKIDFKELSEFLKRRAPGQNSYSTPRKEADEPEFLCGVKNGVTCGTPITAIIRKMLESHIISRAAKMLHNTIAAKIKTICFHLSKLQNHFILFSPSF